MAAGAAKRFNESEGFGFIAPSARHYKEGQSIDFESQASEKATSHPRFCPGIKGPSVFF